VLLEETGIYLPEDTSRKKDQKKLPERNLGHRHIFVNDRSILYRITLQTLDIGDLSMNGEKRNEERRRREEEEQRSETTNEVERVNHTDLFGTFITAPWTSRRRRPHFRQTIPIIIIHHRFLHLSLSIAADRR